MIFSRTRPNMDALADLLLGKDTKAPKPAEASRAPKLRVLDTRTAPPEPVIKDKKELPSGRYIPFSQAGVPLMFEESFALLQQSETVATLLVVPEALQSHPMFDLQRRLKEGGQFKQSNVRAATREIIKSVHAAHIGQEFDTETEVEKKAWQIIEEAIECGASDIHIETRGAFAQVYFRVYGKRIEQPSIATTTATEICNVLYSVKADADSKGTSWDPKVVRNTVIQYNKGGKSAQLRFSSGPIAPAENFHAVMRVVNQDETMVRPLEKVGYTDAQTDVIEEMLIGSQGAVFLVGPTNSGKSTSMQAFIDRIYQVRGESIKVLTVEDPVEYRIKNACQMGVPEGRKGLEDAASKSIFATLLKGMLRQDPDVGMIGEIRDHESAESVKNLVLAGRKLLTTLHVYQVFAVFARLREIGIPESVLFMEGFISGVICQRLVPVLCEHCSMPVTEGMKEGRIRRPTFERVLRVADLTAHDVRVQGNGCKHCHGMGIVGRTPCAELLVPDATFLALMAAGNMAGARQHWQANSGHLDVDGNGVSMVAHAIQKMKLGMVDPTHIETEIGRLILEPSVATSSAAMPAPNFPASLA